MVGGMLCKSDKPSIIIIIIMVVGSGILYFIINFPGRTRGSAARAVCLGSHAARGDGDSASVGSHAARGGRGVCSSARAMCVEVVARHAQYAAAGGATGASQQLLY